MSHEFGRLPDAALTPADAGAKARKQVKQLIWLYIWLLLLEGVLRKWVLPGFANPLLIVRDPVVILIYILALLSGEFPAHPLVTATIWLGFVTLFVSLVSGNGGLFVNLYGWRANFLHLPLIFLVPNYFNAEDVRKVGKWLLITSGPMAVLVLLQFISSGNGILNAGAGGTENGQLESALGKIRPPGTFSFTNGLAMYVCLIVALLLYSATKTKLYPRPVLYVAVPATLLMIGVCGSRGTLGSVAVLLIVFFIICLYKPEFFGKSLKFIVGVVISYLVFCTLTVFQEGLAVHTSRVEGAGGVKVGIIDRYFGEFASGFETLSNAPLLGVGLGMGTNAAAGLITGARTFLLAETEWSRVILESGPVLGSFYLVLRILILISLGLSSWRALKADSLPLLLFGTSALLIISGQFGQPTALGFACLGGGLCMAAAIPAGPPSLESKSSVQSLPRQVRGRSKYAEQLHNTG